MTTVQDIFENARALIDEYNEDGVLIAPSDVATIDTNALRFVNMAYNEIYEYIRSATSYQFVHAPTDVEQQTGAWLEYTLPTDFGQLIEVLKVNEGREKLYEFALEEWNRLYLPVNFDGTIKVNYYPIPSKLTAESTLNFYNPIAIEFMTYYVASNIAMIENPNMANTLLQLRAELKMESKRKQPANEEQIVNVYGRF